MQKEHAQYVMRTPLHNYMLTKYYHNHRRGLERCAHVKNAGTEWHLLCTYESLQNNIKVDIAMI